MYSGESLTVPVVMVDLSIHELIDFARTFIAQEGEDQMFYPITITLVGPKGGKIGAVEDLSWARIGRKSVMKIINDIPHPGPIKIEIKGVALTFPPEDHLSLIELLQAPYVDFISHIEAISRINQTI
jgi:hypothetical protein